MKRFIIFIRKLFKKEVFNMENDLHGKSVRPNGILYVSEKSWMEHHSPYPIIKCARTCMNNFCKCQTSNTNTPNYALHPIK